MSDPNAPRRAPRRPIPLLDALGRLCVEGKQLATYLWQVPDDAAARQKLIGLLDQIAAAGAKQGRKEMPRICKELKAAVQAAPSPQQGDVLVSGFERLFQLWQAAKSGIL